MGPISIAFYKDHERVTSARAHVRTPFPYLQKGWTDYDETWCVVLDSLALRFTKAMNGSHQHVRTCAPYFHIFRTAASIVLKFGVL